MTALQRIAFGIAAVAGFMLLVCAPTIALLQSQRAQITVTVVVNVTPNPLAYNSDTIPAPPGIGAPIAARFALRARGSAAAVDSVTGQTLKDFVAQNVSVQHALKVQAQVTPNPQGTMLISNQQSVAISGTAGTTVSQSCLYTVTVNTTQSTWTLDDGLSANLASGFPGSDLANNTYLQGATPKPTSTPFVVYPTAWTAVASSNLSKTYCVDLTVTIPAAVTGGTYSTNAVYTLYY
ncbi:MAG TPA: hypothetical protein VFL13_11155 [Candidatus Baltobacteraceae bacterium]|nr:hypothetical protein [Candidatus Baltobacteraceae bacterium]